MTATKASSDSHILQWSDIDKYKFFGYGTFLYSALTITLHPMTVLKTRQQVRSSAVPKNSLLHQPTLKSTFRELQKSRGLFRGAGVVVSLAIPARVIYIFTLETSRYECQQVLWSISNTVYPNRMNQEYVGPLVASIAGGVSGGLAAMAAQCLAVPMDVISQRQISMSDAKYATEGSAWSVTKHALQIDGWRALYRGFGLSLFSSLPAGSIWWSIYGGTQHVLDRYWISTRRNPQEEVMFQRVVTQVVSGTSAALVAATLTQPLDVTRTRLQVAQTENASLTQIVSDLKASSGLRGFYRGLGPRILHMSVWGTVLSSAYELLRHVSRAT